MPRWPLDEWPEAASVTVPMLNAATANITHLASAAEHVMATAATSIASGHTVHIGEFCARRPLIEACTEPNSALGTIGSALHPARHVERITAADDILSRATMARIASYIRAHPGCSLHGSLPCTPWSSWQCVNRRRLGANFVELNDKARATSRLMLRNFAQLTRLAAAACHVPVTSASPTGLHGIGAGAVVGNRVDAEHRSAAEQRGEHDTEDE